MKIAFVWYNTDYPNCQWHDGLWAALEILKKKHDIKFFTRPDKPDFVNSIKEWNPDVLLCWGAFTEPFWENTLPYIDKPKYLCFAGGDPTHSNRDLFDHIFVESQEWEDILIRDGYKDKISRAFGTNTKLFKPLDVPKFWTGIYPATFAKWKRHDIFARILKDKGLAVGRKQPGIEPETWQVCLENNVNVLNEVPPNVLNVLYNMSKYTILTSSYWGGSQRQCLESMACNVPVLTLKDSKPAEYVLESGFGYVFNTEEELKDFLESDIDMEFRGGRDYIMKKYSAEKYAEDIQKRLEI